MNKLINVLIVFGTRPEAIKMAPVIIELKLAGLPVKVCVTAQHRSMLDQVNSFFEIVPDYDLDIMQLGQSLNSLAGRLFAGLDAVFEKVEPNWVLVHGDTTTSTVAAWAAYHRGIKVGHIEAGLRTFNKLSPFPEEINRQITGRIADMHFAPTHNAQNNLKKEGIKDNQILVTGNTVIDALHIALLKINTGYMSLDLERIRQVIHDKKRIIAITGHRRENFGQGFEQLSQAIKVIANAYPDVQLIYPVHLNPNVQEPVNRILGDVPNIALIPPLDYPAFTYLLQRSYLVLTDSGGVQEEAPALGKPVLVMRDTTERPEAVEAGTVRLIGTTTKSITNAMTELLEQPAVYTKMSKAINPYGDGKAAKRIMEFFLQ